MWKDLKDTFKEVAEKTIPKKEKKNGSTWMPQDTLRVVEHRRQMKTEGNWAEVRKLNGEIQKRIRKDKENYLKEKCKVLDVHNKRGRTRDLHQQIREIMGKPKINTDSIQSRAGIDYIEKDKIIRRWKEYTEELYKKDAKTYTEVQDKVYT
jgi:lipocalin